MIKLLAGICLSGLGIVMKEPHEIITVMDEPLVTAERLYD
jgi:hypothetical protein